MIANLTLIQTFYVVAHEGSFSAASRILGISYQSATNHVRRLEQLVGDKLIESEKGGRQITLTSRAKTLYNLLHPELERMLSRLTTVINNERPILRIGLPSATFYHLLPDVLPKLQQQFPGIEIQALERDTKLPSLVMDGSVDVCLSETFFGNPTVPQRLLGSYHLSLIYPQAWGDAPSESRQLVAWLADRELVTYESGQSIRNVTIDYLMRFGLRPNIAISTSSSLNLVRCVEAGLGYSFIPCWAIEENNPLIKAQLMTALPQMELYFGYNQYLEKNCYVEFLFTQYEELLESKQAIQKPSTQ